MAENPGVKIIQVATGAPSSAPAPLDERPMLFGPTARGPVSTPILLEGDISSEFLRIFGPPVPGESSWYQVQTAAALGVKALYFSRLASLGEGGAETTASAASLLIPSLGPGREAYYEGDAVTFPFGLDELQTANEATITFDINDDGNDTATVVATPAWQTWGSGTYADPIPGPCTFTYRTSTGPARVVDLEGVEGGFAGVLTFLAATLVGVRVSGPTPGVIQLTTDHVGSGALLVVSNITGTAAVQLGVSAGSFSGSGNVSNGDAITALEIATVISSQVANLTVSSMAPNQLLFQVTPTVLAPESTTLRLVSGTASLVAALGLTNLGSLGSGGIAEGTATSLNPGMVFEAGYRGLPSVGLDGNKLSVELALDSSAPSAGVGNDLTSTVSSGSLTALFRNVRGIKPGAMVYVGNGFGVGEFKTVARVRTLSEGSTYFEVTVTEPFENTWSDDTSVAFLLEYRLDVRYAGEIVETWSRLSPSPDSERYIVSEINDSARGSSYIRVYDIEPGQPKADTPDTFLTGGTSELDDLDSYSIEGSSEYNTGLYALALVKDVTCFGVCYSDDSEGIIAVDSDSLTGAIVRVAESLNGTCDAIMGAPPVRYSEVLSWLDSQGYDTRGGCRYWPRNEVSDPYGSGRRARKLIQPIGLQMGLRARTLQVKGEDGGGFASIPAGDGVFGTLPNVLGLEFTVTDTQHGILNGRGLNVIRAVRQPNGVTKYQVQGGRTMSSDERFFQVGQVRIHGYILRSLPLLAGYQTFRFNDAVSQRKLKRKLEAFLRGLLKDRQLGGDTEAEAFYVVCDATTNTPDVIQRGAIRAKIGARYQVGSEFVEIEFETLTAASAAA